MGDINFTDYTICEIEFSSQIYRYQDTFRRKDTSKSQK